MSTEEFTLEEILAKEKEVFESAKEIAMKQLGYIDLPGEYKLDLRLFWTEDYDVKHFKNSKGRHELDACLVPIAVEDIVDCEIRWGDTTLLTTEYALISMNYGDETVIRDPECVALECVDNIFKVYENIIDPYRYELDYEMINLESGEAEE